MQSPEGEQLIADMKQLLGVPVFAYSDIRGAQITEAGSDESGRLGSFHNASWYGVDGCVLSLELQNFPVPCKHTCLVLVLHPHLFLGVLYHSFNVYIFRHLRECGCT